MHQTVIFPAFAQKVSSGTRIAPECAIPLKNINNITFDPEYKVAFIETGARSQPVAINSLEELLERLAKAKETFAIEECLYIRF